MKREGREVWEQRVRRLKESGLTAKAFAAELGINLHTLQGWKWKLAMETKQSPQLAAKAPFIEVMARHEVPAASMAEGTSGPPEMFEVHPPGRDTHQGSASIR